MNLLITKPHREKVKRTFDIGGLVRVFVFVQDRLDVHLKATYIANSHSTVACIHSIVRGLERMRVLLLKP